MCPSWDPIVPTCILPVTEKKYNLFAICFYFVTLLLCYQIVLYTSSNYASSECLYKFQFEVFVYYSNYIVAIKTGNWFYPAINDVFIKFKTWIFVNSIKKTVEWGHSLIKTIELYNHRWQDSSVVECLPKDWEVCGSNLCHGILLWRWALHLHLAPAAYISIMLLRTVK